MENQVELRSNMFPPYEGEEEEINPGLWGKRLAEYLLENLSKEGVNVVGIGAEDWGWIVTLENKEFPLWIGCGHQYGEDDEFLCFIEPSKPYIRKWFKKIDTTVLVRRVADVLRKILEASPEIHSIKWSTVSNG
ncbi:MAG: hypothetical protein OEL57_10720 [Trichlorobacter sp.]|uniref:hypothetical protein n=1 Tax=Trichlorobacter sp. TaxID=2911007 RepID=UPI00256BD78C|nr:hypothetical protein [Trichlorobacter sp.]MDK9718360.1 hypothetical protein [Trichlorobacter sp.]